MTGRGALLVMLAVFGAGNLLAAWLHLLALAGLSFAVGCVLAVGYARRQALLLVITAPPLIFAVTLLAVQVLTAPGSTVKATIVAVVEGTLLSLAGTAPWLFGGVIVAVALAWIRGLPQCVSDLRADLAGRSDPAGRRGPE